MALQVAGVAKSLVDPKRGWLAATSAPQRSGGAHLFSRLLGARAFRLPEAVPEAGDGFRRCGRTFRRIHGSGSVLLNGSGRVHAFEACPRCFRVLSRNIELNALQNAVALPWAVWNQEGFCEFEDSPDPSISALRPNRTPIQGGKITRVKAIALDHYFGDSDNGAPTLIKVDVEGAELQVLEGARNLLSSPQAPDVVVEYGPRNTARFGYAADEIFSFVRGLGYFIFQWSAGGTLAPVQRSPALPPHGDSCNLLATKTPSRLESLYPELDRRPSPAGGVDGFPDAARSRLTRASAF